MDLIDRVGLTVDYTDAVIIVIGSCGRSCYWLLPYSMGLANLLLEWRKRSAGGGTEMVCQVGRAICGVSHGKTTEGSGS